MFTPAEEVRGPLSYCPRSSLPAKVLTWLASRLAHLLPPRPPGQGGTPPFCLEVRLDAVAAVILDGLSYRRAGRMVGISKTEVGDSLDLLLGPLAALGYCQPDGTFVATLDDLRELLEEMARCGEAVVVGRAGDPGAATPWVGQPEGAVRLQAARPHRPGPVGEHDLGLPVVVDGGWPGSCHEHELIDLSGLDYVLDDIQVASLLDRGFRGLAKTRQHWHAPVGDRHTRGTASPTSSGPTTACRRGCVRWWSSRSPTWPTPGRCVAGAGCCTGSGTSSGPRAR